MSIPEQREILLSKATPGSDIYSADSTQDEIGCLRGRRNRRKLVFFSFVFCFFEVFFMGKQVMLLLGRFILQRLPGTLGDNKVGVMEETPLS